MILAILILPYVLSLKQRQIDMTMGLCILLALSTIVVAALIYQDESK